MKLEEFTADTFRPHTGSQFHVKVDETRTIDLLLEEVKVVLEKHVSPRMNRDSFSLYFIGRADVLLPQATYTVEHDALGSAAIFIVPVGRRHSTGEYLYEAAFT
ncbi:MAG TPA: hypothetical protein VEK11_10445 [Thermoanaerobaculia bacterium]|nr:hypothetical protein [Thermoanaerobaculia bacterium]